MFYGNRLKITSLIIIGHLPVASWLLNVDSVLEGDTLYRDVLLNLNLRHSTSRKLALSKLII